MGGAGMDLWKQGAVKLVSSSIIITCNSTKNLYIRSNHLKYLNIMADKTNPLPEQIIECTRALTETMALQNAVFQEQLDKTVHMAVNAMRELVTISKDAYTIGQHHIRGLEQKLANAAPSGAPIANQAITSPAVTIPPNPPIPPLTEPSLDPALINAVAQSYENAVNAQQQAYILQQAAATQIIASIINFTGIYVAVAFENAEKQENQHL
jgi:hypothetical protein